MCDWQSRPTANDLSKWPDRVRGHQIILPLLTAHQPHRTPAARPYMQMVLQDCGTATAVQKRRSTAESANAHSHAQQHRRHTADKPQWDGRTKAVHPANVLDTRGLGRSQLSQPCSRASSDAGSVLDSLLGTPKHRQVTRAQQQYTLQAAASRLHHQSLSCTLSAQPSQDWPSPPASVHDDTSCHTTRWIEEHVQWEQQQPDDLLHHEMEQKRAMQQLSGAVQCLEAKLDTLMSEQSCSQTSWRIGVAVHSAPTQESSSAAVQSENTAVPSQKDADVPTAMAAVKGQNLQPAHLMDTNTMADTQGVEQPCCSSDHQDPAASVSTTNDAMHLQHSAVQRRHDACTGTEARSQLDAPYMRWLNVVTAVEAASSQLTTQIENCTRTSVSYARLLQMQQHAAVQSLQSTED